MIKLYTAGKTFNRINTIGADTYVVMATYVNMGGTTFEGAPVTGESIKRNVTKNGAPFFSSDQTDYYRTSPSFRIDGRSIPGAAASYFVSSPTDYTKLPVTGKPGDSGPFYNATIYDSAAKTVTVGTSAQTWNITADSDTTVRFCIHTVITIGNSATSQDDCYKIDTAGEIPSVLFSTPSTTPL
jgi:hypothetical protein